jgi:hypothetical protein
MLPNGTQVRRAQMNEVTENQTEVIGFRAHIRSTGRQVTSVLWTDRVLNDLLRLYRDEL